MAAPKWMPAFHELTAKNHIEQAKWWLNGFWADGAEAEAENIYKIVDKFIELEWDERRILGAGALAKAHAERKMGADLDEMKAHRLLEAQGEVLTVMALRKKLVAMDLDKNRQLSISEYLLFKYGKAAAELVNSPQGTASKEDVDKAQAMVNEAMSALESCVQEEKALEKLQADLKAAIDEMKKQEEEYNGKIAKLEAISNSDAGVVTKNRAKNELAQLKDEDPLPLRRAKITQQAALRKVEKQTKVVQTRGVELKGKVDEANEYLEKVKKSGDVAQGDIWWMQRELQEVQSYRGK